MNIGGEQLVLTIEDVIITTEDLPGWLVANDNELTVALDIHITPELEAEGMARELVNRIQNVRKAIDLNVTDRIRVVIEDIPEVKNAIEQFSGYISGEVLADEISLSNTVDAESIDLYDGVAARIAISKS